jgi:hypothetical protein
VVGVVASERRVRPAGEPAGGLGVTHRAELPERIDEQLGERPNRLGLGGWGASHSHVVFYRFDCEKLNGVRSHTTTDPAPGAPGVLGLLAEPLGPELVRRLPRAVIDPELGVSIVDLGLVYDIAVDAGGPVAIAMTLTTSRCPLGGSSRMGSGPA